jgi:hypothetical protein
MQKLVTIYLDSSAYSAGAWLKASNADQHGVVEEHLGDYLSDGWVIKSIHGFGGASESMNARGYVIVLLERG